MGEPTFDLPSLDERCSVRSQVIHALRGALITGQMRPGEVYSAPALATRFGVSATPVREAMLELVKEGLVSTVPNKGFRVRELSDRELDEITELRLFLEVPGTAAVIGRASAADLAPQQALSTELVRLAAAGDLVAYVEQDRRFHLGLLELAGNAELVRLVGELRARSRLFGLRGLSESGRLTASAREHVAMLDLVKAGDRPGLEELVTRHIGHVRRSWAGRPEPGEA